MKNVSFKLTSKLRGSAAFHDSCTSHVSCILHFADNVFHLQISFWKHFEGPIHKLPFGSIPNRAEGRKT